MIISYKSKNLVNVWRKNGDFLSIHENVISRANIKKMLIISMITDGMASFLSDCYRDGSGDSMPWEDWTICPS
jgi:hypothetical protein